LKAILSGNPGILKSITAFPRDFIPASGGSPDIEGKFSF
jgi:hypothetical protein